MPVVLDQKICSRARLARDARFDGKFYIAVRTTRIYCRPICRSRSSREENVCYFASAAAASAAGYRPCLRCRPESSPGTPAWAGTKTTVARALRLLNETGLEEGGVEALAAHLGIGSRHLRRLFLRHLGASPRAVAQTRRLQFAKKLIDETRLQMTQIAIAAGFGTVRRFNASIRSVYHRTPTEIRALAGKRFAQGENEYEFRLVFRQPYNWRHALNCLRARAIDGLEIVEGQHYRRTFCFNGHQGSVRVSLAASEDALIARVQVGEPGALFGIIQRLRSMFDLDADWGTIEKSLMGDPILAARILADPGRRVLGCLDGFEFAVRSVLRQHMSHAEERLLTEQLVRAYGRPYLLEAGLTHVFPPPESLQSADIEAVGLPRTQAEAIRGLARAITEARLSFDKVADPQASLSTLAGCSGISARTVKQVAMRVLRDTDAFPLPRFTLIRALGLKGPDARERLRAWQPWRAYAAIYLCDDEPRTAVPVHPESDDITQPSALRQQIAFSYGTAALG
jgi:AraC family transcriptional regulator of adaptative response / DNA-3-methyladenine glycosylase II